jgi:hypothetical protein
LRGQFGLPLATCYRNGNPMISKAAELREQDADFSSN